MGLLIDLINIVTAVIALSAILCAVTTPPDNKWAKKAYKLMNYAAFNMWKSEDR
jgi:hypothetical protein